MLDSAAELSISSQETTATSPHIPAVEHTKEALKNAIEITRRTQEVFDNGRAAEIARRMWVPPVILGAAGAAFKYFNDKSIELSTQHGAAALMAGPNKAAGIGLGVMGGIIAASEGINRIRDLRNNSHE